MGAFLRVLLADLRSFVPWVLWATVTLAVAVSGPFGSYGAMSMAERFLFWPPVIAVAVAVATAVRAFVYGPCQMGGTLRGTLLGTVLNCLILCPLFFLLIQFAFPPLFSTLSRMAEIVLLVASMSLGICALRESAEIEVAETPAAPEKPLPRLLRRIDPPLQGDIWAITVRDHYVDVQTSLGKSSLLMRFSDAIDEVDCLPGAQVHRSHWVAWSGVGSVCREGGKMILHLKNGHQIPVSRNHRDKVDAMFPLLPDAKTVAA